jgi:hypothetical protein
MTISWLTNDNCFSHVAYGTNNESLDNIVHGSSSSYEFYYNNQYKSGYLHHVLLTNLQPLTIYYYKCGDFMLQIVSNIFNFKTLPKIGYKSKLTFGILGDIGQTKNSVSTLNHLIREHDIDMILHAGDLSYADCNQSLWDSYGEMIEPLASYKPWMVCPGNHEIEFNSFDSGLAHIIYLNPYTNSNPTSLQYNWLENNLASIDRSITPWVIVVMHCPWYSSNINHYADTQTILMRESMESLFYQYNVNIVFNGHVHDYERTYPVYRNETDIHGPVYITIGNAGNLEGLDNKYYDEPKWSAFRNGTEYGYGKLTIIDEKRLFWSWYINDGKQMFPRDKSLLCNSVFNLINCK